MEEFLGKASYEAIVKNEEDAKQVFVGIVSDKGFELARMNRTKFVKNGQLPTGKVMVALGMLNPPKELPLVEVADKNTVQIVDDELVMRYLKGTIRYDPTETDVVGHIFHGKGTKSTPALDILAAVVVETAKGLIQTSEKSGNQFFTVMQGSTYITVWPQDEELLLKVEKDATLYLLGWSSTNEDKEKQKVYTNFNATNMFLLNRPSAAQQVDVPVQSTVSTVVSTPPVQTPTVVQQSVQVAPTLSVVDVSQKPKIQGRILMSAFKKQNIIVYNGDSNDFEQFFTKPEAEIRVGLESLLKDGQVAENPQGVFTLVPKETKIATEDITKHLLKVLKENEGKGVTFGGDSENGFKATGLSDTQIAEGLGVLVKEGYTYSPHMNVYEFLA